MLPDLGGHQDVEISQDFYISRQPLAESVHRLPPSVPQQTGESKRKDPTALADRHVVAARLAQGIRAP